MKFIFNLFILLFLFSCGKDPVASKGSSAALSTTGDYLFSARLGDTTVRSYFRNGIVKDVSYGEIFNQQKVSGSPHVIYLLTENLAHASYLEVVSTVEQNLKSGYYSSCSIDEYGEKYCSGQSSLQGSDLCTSEGILVRGEVNKIDEFKISPYSSHKAMQSIASLPMGSIKVRYKGSVKDDIVVLELLCIDEE